MCSKELKSGGQMNLTDEKLMKKFQNGDTEALNELYERYRATLFRFIYRCTRDDQLSMDVVQDAFLKLQQKKHYFSPEKGRLKTYLFQIAYHTMISKIKMRARWHRLLPFLYKEPVTISRSDEKMEVERMLQSLSNEQRAVIVLFYYHDLSKKDIARILNIPLGTVKSRLHQAVQKMRKEWGIESDGKGS